MAVPATAVQDHSVIPTAGAVFVTSPQVVPSSEAGGAEVFADVNRLLAQPADERLANLERFARCVTVRFRRRPASQDELDLRRLMPSILAGQNEDMWEYDSCAICLTDFADGEELRRAPCVGGHAFHPKCLRGWLDRSHTTCPVCRGGSDERDQRPRSPGRPSPEALAEYVIRRMRSGKVDFTISAANQKSAGNVMSQLREIVPAIQEEASECDSEPSRTQAIGAEAVPPTPALEAIFSARIEARKAERRKNSPERAPRGG